MKNIYLILVLFLFALLAGCGDDGETNAIGESNEKVEVGVSESEPEESLEWSELSYEDKESKVKEQVELNGLQEMYSTEELIEELDYLSGNTDIEFSYDFAFAFESAIENLSSSGMVELLTVNEQLGNDSYTELIGDLHGIEKIVEKDGTVYVFHGFSGSAGIYLSVAKDNKWIVKDKLIHGIKKLSLFTEEESSMFTEETQQALIDMEFQYGGVGNSYFSHDSIIYHRYDNDTDKSVIIEVTFDETGVTGSKIVSKDYIEGFGIVDTLGGEQLFLTEQNDGKVTHVNIFEDVSLTNPVYSYDVEFEDYWDLHSSYPFLDRDRDFLYTGDDSNTIKIDVTTGEPNWDAQGQLIEYEIPYERSFFLGDDLGLIVAAEPKHTEEIQVSRYDFDLNPMNEMLIIDDSGVNTFVGGTRTDDELHVWREVEFKDQKSIQMTPYSID